MKTEVILDLFRNNRAGLPPTEVAQVYETEYSKEREARKPGPWDVLRPNAGWFISCILLLWLVFRKSLEEWLKAVVDAIGEGFRRRFAGSRLFRGMALRCYQRDLIQKYALLQIPFSGKKLEMRKIFVPLKVMGATGADHVDAYRAMKESTRLMIVGPPGSGKSMLLKNLTLVYAEGRLNDFPDWPVPILLELHRLNEKPDLDLQRHLVDALARKGFPKADRFVERNLGQGTLMLLLDGLDEVNSAERPKVVGRIRDLMEMEKNRKCRVVITCRNAVYRGEFACDVDQTVEIVEFSDQQIRAFLRTWEPHMPRERSTEQLMQILRDRPRIMALARNPLLLTIIAYLYTDTPYVIPHSRTEFYRRATEVLLDIQHRERNVYEARAKQAVLQQLALFYQDSARQREQDRRSVDFRTVLDQVKGVLPRLNLSPEKDTGPLLSEIVDRTGLLLSIDGGQRYQFAHLTLQEYFAAEQLFDDGNGLFERFYKDGDTWRETVKLWCGLNHDSTSLVANVYAEDPVTALECLADAQQIDQGSSEQIVDSFKSQIAAGGDVEALARAFGAVASDSRPRGKAVLEFLEDLLDKAEDRARLQAAASALSYTNLPRAAEALARRYESGSEVRAALIRMGDLAVPSLRERALNGDVDALNDLLTIGTPQAAAVLVTAIYAPSPDTRAAAAWRLAVVLRQPDVEEALRQSPLTDDESGAEAIHWLWRPFAEPPGSTLPLIAGRVGEIIDKASYESLQDSDYHIDPRIAIPLIINNPQPIMKSITLMMQSFAGDKGRICDPSTGLEVRDMVSEMESQRMEMKVVSSIARHHRDAAKGGNSPQIQTEAASFLRWFYNSCELPAKDRALLNSLPYLGQVDLFSRFKAKRQPVPNDWGNLYRPVVYVFGAGWHRKAVVLAVIAAAIVVCFIAGREVYRMHAFVSWRSAAFILFSSLAIMYLFLIITITLDIEGFFHMTATLVVPMYLYLYMLMRILRRDFSDFKCSDYVEFITFLFVILIGAWAPAGAYLAAPYLIRSGYRWTTALACYVAFLIACALIYYAGYRRHQAAQNPLHGILDQPFAPTESRGQAAGVAASAAVSGN